MANIRAILREDSLTAFEARIEELTHTTEDDGSITVVALTDDAINNGLNAVARTVFPHRALILQKQWMRCGMRKPRKLSFRKTVAAVGRLNNCLPLFPDGKEQDKFSAEELVELLEWSITQAWRTKFDLDGYIPTNHNKERLITECEAIERNEPWKKVVDKKSAQNAKASVAKRSRTAKHKSGTTSSSADKTYYCSEHGQNATHGTDKCFTLKNRAGKSKGAGTTSTLTKKSFRREINTLSKARPKKKVIEMFAVVLQKEHAKLKATKSSPKKRN